MQLGPGFLWPPAFVKAFATRYANAILRFIGRFYDGVEAECACVRWELQQRFAPFEKGVRKHIL